MSPGFIFFIGTNLRFYSINLQDSLATMEWELAVVLGSTVLA